MSDTRAFRCYNTSFSGTSDNRAIYAESSSVDFEMCYFNKFLDSEGSALFLKNSNASIVSSSFDSNRALLKGGAVALSCDFEEKLLNSNQPLFIR